MKSAVVKFASLQNWQNQIGTDAKDRLVTRFQSKTLSVEVQADPHYIARDYYQAGAIEGARAMISILKLQGLIEVDYR